MGFPEEYVKACEDIVELRKIISKLSKDIIEMDKFGKDVTEKNLGLKNEVTELRKCLKNLSSRATTAEQRNGIMNDTLFLIRNESSDLTAVGYVQECFKATSSL